MMRRIRSGRFSLKKGAMDVSEKAEITFMQTRLIRLASEEWKMPSKKVMGFFIARVMKQCWKILRNFLKVKGGRSDAGIS